MFTVQLDKTLQSFIQLFYRIGIWQSDEESTVRRAGKKLFYTFFGALFPIFFALNSLLCDDRNESIFSIQISIATAVVYVKLLYLLNKKEEILEFLNDQTVVHSIENREEYKRANKKIEKLVRVARAFLYMVLFTSILNISVTLPVFSNGKSLPAFITFSWNDSEIIYWLAYLCVSLSIVLYIVVNLFTTLIWYIMFNYSIEYKLMGNKLRNLGVGKESIKKKHENKQTMKTRAKTQKNVRPASRSVYVENLIVWIKAHRNLTETVERFRSCFSTIFLAQITTSGIIICVAVYNLAFASGQNIIQIELYTALLIYAILDIFMVMYLANEITAASDRLLYCLFESNWVEQTESCKKYVLIMGEVLKQPQQLVVLIYPMNLETFTSTVNGAYSMFNILKSFQ